MPRPRDSRRQKLYDSEWSLPGDRVGDVPAFIQKVVTSAYVQTRWGKITVGYAQTHGDGGTYHSGSDGGWIYTGKNPRRLVVLHEIAHRLMQAHGRKYASHGPEFAATMLTLVDRFGEPGQGRKLREAYVKNRVIYRTGFAAVPKPGSRPVVTKAAAEASRTAERRAAIRRPIDPYERRAAAKTLRLMIAKGEFGAAGSKTRTHALAVARKLEQKG